MLILTEKPSVAKSFADALGVPRKDSFWENSDYCVVNALGHLLEDYLPEDYDPALKKWSLEGLPIIPETVKYKEIEKTKQQLAVVRKCFYSRKNDPFLLATDAEREGELIGAEILDYVGFKNYSGARRFWVSEALTPEVVRKGIETAKPLLEYSSYREQGFARQHADWLVGMNLTRLVTLKSGKLLHFGRVQTALLGAIHEREKSIAGFTPEKFFEVKAVLTGASPFLVDGALAGSYPFSVKLINPDNGEFPTRFSKDSKMLADIEKEKDSLKKGVVTELEKEKKTVHPPQLFNLTALQKEAHKKYSYSPEQTLDIAQALYETHKCLSYPRTPSRVMGDENVDLVKKIFLELTVEYEKTVMSEYMTGASSALVSADNKRLFNSAELQDHHALIPLAPIPKNCSEQENNIYNLVFERFFTILKPPYIYNSVSINVDISNRQFRGNGVEVLQTGWKSSHNADEDEEEPENYAGLEKDREYSVISVNIEEKKTEPKKHYTFASLLQLMENPRGDDGKRLTGLGTPATRGAILQKLVDRKYVSLKGKNILITDDGRFLIENILKNDGLASFISIPETTRWEEQLRENTSAFLEGIRCFVRRSVAGTGMETYNREKTSLGKCPLCGGEVYEGRKNYYCCNYKGEKPCNFAVWKEICGAAVSPAEAQTLLDGKKTKMKKCVSGKTGKEFKAAFYLCGDKILMQFEEKKK